MNDMDITLFDKTFNLTLKAGHLRYAELEGENITLKDMDQTNDFALGCRLAYITMLPDLPDNKGENDVQKALAQRDDCDEIAMHCLEQFMDMQQELGKFLERVRSNGTTTKESSTLTESTA